jgi:hypothetical protein
MIKNTTKKKNSKKFLDIEVPFYLVIGKTIRELQKQDI